jgi:acylpyruvate hydrolase
MKILSFQDAQAQAAVGLVSADGRRVIPLRDAVPDAPRDIVSLLASTKALDAARAALAAAKADAGQPIDKLRLLPVVPNPGKVVCLGVNYADHAKEGGHAPPEYPAFFLRAASSQVAHGQPIVRPRASDKLDYEAELALVIGKRSRHLTPANALEAVAGYACYNDGSIRDYQRKTSQWTMGKNFDGTGAFGPWLVTPDELPPAAHGLRIQSRLNGQVMQDANTRDFLCDVVRALCLISECMTLEPGDVIITGTPGGVGYARTPPVWMKPGDVVEIEIEGVGVLRNPIAAED